MKKVICIFLSVLLLIPALCCAASAAGIKAVYTLQNDGLTSYWTDEQGKRVELDTVADYTQEIEDVGAALPAAYFSTDVTPVKDQSPTNGCWTYSVLSVLESDYIKQGFGTKKNTDFSESHLIWFANNGLSANADDPTAGDGTALKDPYDAGGSFLMAINALARGAGIATESRYPMPDAANPPEYTVDQMYVSDARIGDALFLENTADIKQAIMDNGGVAVCFYMDSAGMKTNNTPYSNENTAYVSDTVTTVNHKLSYAPNHAATIVGWDDTFARSHFSNFSMPSKAGAWLCKNSWGTDFGDGGYFWMSYEDTTMRDYTTLTVLPANAYDSIAQYDGYGYNSSVTIGDSAAAFTANVFRADKKGSVRYVAFHTLTPDLPYTVYIYRGVAFDSGNPTDGTLALTVTGTASFAGYHTVDIGKDVPVQNGEYYSVVVEFPLRDGQNLNIPVEGRTVTQNRITYNFDGKENTSYIGYNEDGCAWIDTVAQGYNNTCVKACLVNKTAAAKTMTSPKTLVDRATGVRVAYDTADFAAGANVTLQVFENNSAADFVKKQMSDKYGNVQATGYEVSLLVNGRVVTAAESGFKVILPLTDISAENLQVGQLTPTADGGQSLYYFFEQADGGFITFYPDDLQGSLVLVACSEKKDVSSPAIKNNESLITSIMNFIRRLFEFFRNFLLGLFN